MRLSFREPIEVQNAKTELLAWNREMLRTEQIKFERCLAIAGNAWLGNNRPTSTGGTAGRGRYDNSSPGSNAGRVRFENVDTHIRPPTPTKSYPAGTLALQNGQRDPERPTGKIWISYNTIDATIWKSLYGTKTVGGKQLQLCWYHCNRPRGCNSATCTNYHTNYPTAYLPGSASDEPDQGFSIGGGCEVQSGYLNGAPYPPLP